MPQPPPADNGRKSAYIKNGATTKSELQASAIPLTEILVILKWLLFAVVLTLICLAMFGPHNPQWLLGDHDKLQHFLAFSVLGVSARAVCNRCNPSHFWLVILACAPLLEILQHIIQPGRTFSVADGLANALGILFAFISLAILGKFTANGFAKAR